MADGTGNKNVSGLVSNTVFQLPASRSIFAGVNAGALYVLPSIFFEHETMMIINPLKKIADMENLFFTSLIIYWLLDFLFFLLLPVTLKA